MSNIPPLVCNTPPPIDDFEDQIDDDINNIESADEGMCAIVHFNPIYMFFALIEIKLSFI